MNEQVERLKELLKVAKALPVRTAKSLMGLSVRWNQGTLGVYERECGTTACLAGFAGLTPYFIKNGLMYDKQAGFLMDAKGEYLGIFGVGRYFGMNAKEIDQTFFYVPEDLSNSEIKRRLIARIERLVRKYSRKRITP